MSTIDGNWAYTYDGSGQLIHAIFVSTNGEIANQDLEFHYDVIGNRTSTVINGVATNYVANNLNEYASVGGVACQYDADGNLTFDGIRTYEYDAQKRLTRTTGPDGITEYEYDAFGTRTAKIMNGDRTEYLSDPIGLGNVVEEFDGSDNLRARNTYGLNLISRSLASESTNYFDYDAIGSTAGLTDQSGTNLSRYTFSPFGNQLVLFGSDSNPFGFVGQSGVACDQSGLYFMRSRYYLADFGRFLSSDPIGLRARDPNFYRYAANSPVTLIDPHGLETVRGSMGRDDSWSQVWNQIDSDANSNLPGGGGGGGGGSGGSGGGGSSGSANSVDPNGKLSPMGVGGAHYIQSGAALPYCVNFENDPAASAPAQQVTITDQLNTNLDWESFQLTEVGYGDTFIPVPPNSQHFETTVVMTCCGDPFEVQIEAGIHLATDEVYANFRSIDPNTSLPPPVSVGFLPPEDGTGRGQGHFS